VTDKLDTEIGSGILPWTRGCFVCGESNPRGLHLKSRLENGCVVLDYTMRETDQGYRNLVHGGVAATLLDEVMTWAAILGSRRPCVAAEWTTRLKKPVETGQRVRVEGRISGGRPRLLLAEGVILDEKGSTVASATGKYVPMHRDKISLCLEDFVSSPDAIDPARLMGSDR